MTDDLRPVEFYWDGEHMVPLDRYAPLSRRQYTKGEVYRMVVEEERSMASHRHFFACVNEAWKNLPHELSENFPTADKLRHWCLIKRGFCTEQSYVYETETDAVRTAELLGRGTDDTVVVARGNIVKVYRAMSQSTRSMKKALFQRSKDAVMDQISELIGVTVEELTKNAGQSA